MFARSVVISALLVLVSSASFCGAAWTFAANEWSGAASDSQARWIRFGDGTNWVSRVILTSWGVRCSGDTFGSELLNRFPSAYGTNKTRWCEYGDYVYDTSNTVRPDLNHPTHKMPFAPRVDLSRLPVRGKSWGQALTTTIPARTVAPSREHPSGSEFRISCPYSHMAFDDPLVFPDKRGASHLHMFFGNNLVSAFTKIDDLRRGNSTCNGGILNRSAYWIPALLDENGVVQIPSTIWYYKINTNYVNTTIGIPFGLSMIIGNASAKGPGDNKDQYWWTCSKDDTSVSNRTSYIRKCNEVITLFIAFRQCWDGKNLQVPDHRSHVVSPGAGNVCPPTHPIGMPQLSLNVHWDVPAGVDSSKWRLSSDAYSPDLPGGYSAHADFISGWTDAGMKDGIVPACFNQRKDCSANGFGNTTSMDPVPRAPWEPNTHEALPEDYMNDARLGQFVPPPSPSSSSPSPQSAGSLLPQASSNVDSGASVIGKTSPLMLLLTICIMILAVSVVDRL